MTSMHPRRILSLTIAAVSLIALPAAAHGGKAKGAGYERLLERADKNKDGVVAKEELAARHEQARNAHLAKVDANKDGKVSPEERAAARKEMAKQRFTRMDKNGDGQIGAGDVGEKRWQRLSGADADKSGSVSFAELEQAFSAGKMKRHGR